jgi:hypothetical protein
MEITIIEAVAYCSQTLLIMFLVTLNFLQFLLARGVSEENWNASATSSIIKHERLYADNNMP